MIKSGAESTAFTCSSCIYASMGLLSGVISTGSLKNSSYQQQLLLLLSSEAIPPSLAPAPAPAPSSTERDLAILPRLPLAHSSRPGPAQVTPFSKGPLIQILLSGVECGSG